MACDFIHRIMIFSVMKNEMNYFEKFVADLEAREERQRLQNEQLEKAREMWEKRQEIEKKYREHAKQRIRYIR